MEGPTPVSALIHAATLVTAGIYLLLRSSPLLEFSPTALLVITLVGATTAFFAATCGLVQNDLKRIIAFSTISQLGYCFIIFIIVQILVFNTIFDFNFPILQSCSANIFPLSNSSKLTSSKSTKNGLNIKGPKDMFFYFSPSIDYVDKYNDFSHSGRSVIKIKYTKLQGIYL
jgi:NADH:ubiquinone oxidoreductase subunit 2 (subunit N)